MSAEGTTFLYKVFPNGEDVLQIQTNEALSTSWTMFALSLRLEVLANVLKESR